jgi:hypothetical protein
LSKEKPVLGKAINEAAAMGTPVINLLLVIFEDIIFSHERLPDILVKIIQSSN